MTLALLSLGLASCSTEGSSSALTTTSSAASSSSVSASVSETDSSDTSEESSSSSAWVDYGSTELTEDMLDAVSGTNLTLKGHLFIGMLSESTPYGVEIQYEGGANLTSVSTLAQDFETGDEIPMTTQTYSYEGDNGDAYRPQNPDKDNEVSYDTGVSFEKSGLYTNPLSSFQAADFAIDYSYTGPGYKFSYVGEDDDAVLAAYANLASTATSDMYTFYGDLLTDLSLYTDGAAIQSIGIKAESSDPDLAAMGLSLSLNYEIQDVGTTKIDEESVLVDPYAIPADQTAQYDAFQKALDTAKADNYHFTAVAADADGVTFQTSEAYATPEGWAGVETADGQSAYYGVVANDDGTFDYYGGSAADKLEPSYKTYKATHHLPTYDFSTAIFDLNTEKSTDDLYVFDIKDDFLEHYYASAVVNEITYDSFADTASDLEFAITKDGLIQSFSFAFTHDGDDATFVETFDSFGGVTEIPTTIADFTGYVPLEVPSSWEEATDQDDIAISMMLEFMANGDQAEYLLSDALKPYFVGFSTGFDNDNNVVVQLTLIKEYNSESCIELYELAKAELEKTIGTTLTVPNSLTYFAEATLENGLTYNVQATTDDTVLLQVYGPMAF